MSADVWKWYVGSSEEEFHTTCETRDEAVAEALQYEGAWIIEATKGRPIKLSAYFDAAEFIDDANDTAYVFADPDGDGVLFDVRKAQMDDINETVRSAIDEWQDKHELTFEAWRFSDSRNLQWIDAGPVAAEGGDA